MPNISTPHQIQQFMIRQMAIITATLTSGRPHTTRRRDLGQATTEYALVMLGAAMVAVLLIGWATTGGGAAVIGRLFNKAVNSVIDQL